MRIVTENCRNLFIGSSCFCVSQNGIKNERINEKVTIKVSLAVVVLRWDTLFRARQHGSR